MSSGCKQRFALFAAGWTVSVLAVTWFFRLSDQFLLVLLAYVGFLLAVEYSEPAFERPTWHRRLRWVSAVGMVWFVASVYLWVQQVIGRPLL